MFALCASLGLPAVFFTVTPEDGYNVRVLVYSREIRDMSDIAKFRDYKDINEISDECVEMRFQFPGFCCTEYQTVLDIVIEHILGWDSANCKSKNGGGCFGEIEGWYVATEEQGRKTLHSHFLLWIKNWGELLAKLYSNREEIRKRGAEEMQQYADSVMSTKVLSVNNMSESKYITNICKSVHNNEKMEPCNGSIQPVPHQQLRNMRYSFCSETKTDMSIARCNSCSFCVTAGEIVNEVLKECHVAGENSDKFCNVMLMQDLMGEGKRSERRKDRVLQISRNMHAERHRPTCFKKDDSCRSCLPKKPQEDTKVHFFNDHVIRWYTWSGEKAERIPFMVECDRHFLDVFSNTYHNTTSKLLKSNTNVQTGIDGAHIMYTTCYTSKSNRTEEKLAVVAAMEGLHRRMKAEMAKPYVEPDVVNGFKRLLSCTFSATEGYVLGAPMAKFLLQNGSRFKSSHEFGYIPLYDFVNKSVFRYSVRVKSKGIHMTNLRENYLYRPYELNSPNILHFYTSYNMVAVNNKTKKEYVDLKPFLKEHSSKGKAGVFLSERKQVPILYHDMLEDSSKFLCDIMKVDEVPESTANMIEL